MTQTEEGSRSVDYRLGGEADRRAVEAGLADATWYRSPIDPHRLTQLAQRSDGAASGNVALFVALLVTSGLWAYSTLWSWWTVPALFVYGTLYGSSADPRWHECGHGTAFRTAWLNELVYYPASFMVLRDPTVWRWSHVRHHSDTIIVGRDPEVVLKRPPQLGEWLLTLFSLKSGPTSMARTVRHAFGRIADADRSYIPERELPKVIVEARVYVAIWIALAAWCALAGSLVPLVFFVGPSFYGAWLVLVLGTSQHLGLRENVLDHRLNTRTIYMNPVLRFLYWNMNYHCEHHMFPTVPSRALPALHEEIKTDLPAPGRSLLAAYREIIPALRHQHRDPTWELDRPLPFAAGTATRDAGHGAEQRVLHPVATGDGDWIDVCGSDDLSIDDVARVDVGDRTLAIYHVEDGYYATDGICTHSRQVHLAGGLVIDGQIECPKHNGRFDIVNGEAVRAPACQALNTHEVRARAGRIHVRISDSGAS